MSVNLPCSHAPLRLCAILFVFLFPVITASQEPAIIQVVCHKSYYAPDTIHLKRGEPVRLLLKSEDVTHGFAIDEFDIAREVPAGPPTVIEFTPHRTGMFSFYCVVRCGKNHLKMRGTLIVE